MRWPNDVLVGDRKIAGLLLDQFTAALVVAGIGINVFNQPETEDPMLRGQTARLADLLCSPPSLSELTAHVLRHLSRVLLQMESRGFQSLLPRVNALWGAPRKIELDLDGQFCRGTFAGVDQNGNLLLSDESGVQAAYAAHQVRHLQEI
jgi:BirA family biotin operon repressor/biotin-[acetyl-CoA-carboxylase] ligase